MEDALQRLSKPVRLKVRDTLPKNAYVTYCRVDEGTKINAVGKVISGNRIYIEYTLNKRKYKTTISAKLGKQHKGYRYEP